MQILCATDFSESASGAADVAAAIAQKLRLPLTLLHCGHDFAIAGEFSVMEPLDELGREQLKAEAERLRATGVKVTEEFRRGSAGWEILKVVEAQATGLIVIGSEGKGRARRWLIGSVAERVAEGAPVPTLVVRQPGALLSWLRGGGALRTLCGVDFTISADAAVAAIKNLRAMGEVEVEAGYIDTESDSRGPDERQADRQRDVWERLHAVLGDLPVKIHVRGAQGQPAEEFVSLAEERNAGLLVVGTHQRHGWQRLMAPSFSRRALAHAVTNVLCVPAASYTPEFRVPRIRRVLVATDFSEVSHEALRQACGLLPSGGEVRLLHVCPQPSTGVDPVLASEIYFDHSQASSREKADAENRMKDLVPRLLAISGITATSEVLVHEDLAAAICEAAERFAAEVICLGARGLSRVGTALLGSVVQGVIARSHRPVMVVPPPRS